jgi:hypothetical protein
LRRRRRALVRPPDLHVVTRPEHAHPAAVLRALDLRALVARVRGVRPEDGAEVGVPRHGALEQLHVVPVEGHLAELDVDLSICSGGYLGAQPHLVALRRRRA